MIDITVKHQNMNGLMLGDTSVQISRVADPIGIASHRGLAK